MSIEAVCPSCKKHYRVDDKLAGRPVQCKACQTKFNIPLPPPPKPAPDDTQVEIAFVDDKPTTPPPSDPVAEASEEEEDWTVAPPVAPAVSLKAPASRPPAGKHSPAKASLPAFTPEEPFKVAVKQVKGPSALPRLIVSAVVLALLGVGFYLYSDKVMQFVSRFRHPAAPVAVNTPAPAPLPQTQPATQPVVVVAIPTTLPTEPVVEAPAPVAETQPAPVVVAPPRPVAPGLAGVDPVLADDLHNLHATVFASALGVRVTGTTKADDVLAKAAQIPNLFDLELNGALNDQSWKTLAGLTQLKILSLQNAGATDPALQSLTSLTKLEKVTLTGSPKLTDASLDTLAPLTHLTNLNLTNDKAISDSGVSKLKTAPKLLILNLDGTSIDAKVLDTFEAMPNLKTLSLSNTKIDTVSRLRFKENHTAMHISP